MSLRESAAFTLAAALALQPFLSAQSPSPTAQSAEQEIDREFLAVPSAKLAGEHLKALTAAPHAAASKEDYATAEYVAARFRAAGLETTIVPYKVWLSFPER